MLVFASLHIHPANVSADETCTECIHHQCGGHITQQTAVFQACLLCQFLTLPMLAIGVTTLIIYNKVYREILQALHSNACSAHHVIVGLRAPPVFSI